MIKIRKTSEGEIKRNKDITERNIQEKREIVEEVDKRKRKRR